MATPSVLTPIKRRDGTFSTRFAGGRMALTPSPQQPKAPAPEPQQPGESIHHSNGNLKARFSRAQSKTNVRDSPKSNIAARQSPRHQQQVSDFSLVGTGSRTPSRPRSRGRVHYNATDRFIPNREASKGISTSGAALKLDATADLFSGLSMEDHEQDEDRAPKSKPRASPSTIAYQQSVAEACGIDLKQRILAFKPAPPESSRPVDLRSQYNRPLKPAAATSSRALRRVLTSPERVLDAPNLVDDYYLNLLDWSSGNQIAIGLDRNVYVWSADSGSVSSLLECPEDTYISSVKWSRDGAYVAAGFATGEVQIWDAQEGAKLRSMYGHEDRVGVMAWNKHILSTGDRKGNLYNHDVRVAQHKVASLVAHSGEICGLEWRSDGGQLATGGNDNLVTIWDARQLDAPKFEKTNHTAAIKALAWCPWQSNLLATGGGSHDRMIHFWNTTSGARVNSIDTGSQVTSLRWSVSHKEIVSSSGFPDNSLSLWNYPSLVKTYDIPAHDSRVLQAALSPDGQMLATAAADESLKFWKLFEKKGPANTASGSGNNPSSMIKELSIR